MSTDAVADVEDRILVKVSALKASVMSAENDTAMAVCRELEMLWAERNRKLAVSK